jgi:putative endonuclease
MSEVSPKQPWYRRWFGTRSERAAERFLKARKHRILTRNWKCQLGELDLITRDGETLVFVEVRSTESPDPLSAAASVDEQKQSQLTRLALYFMKRHKVLQVPARFDVITIAWPPGVKEPRIEHHANAFSAVGLFRMYS